MSRAGDPTRQIIQLSMITHWTKTEVENLPWSEFWDCYWEAVDCYRQMNAGPEDRGPN